MDTLSPCPNCGSRTLYEGPSVSSGGGHAPVYLPGLGTFWRAAKFTVVGCWACGLTRLFAVPDARARLGESRKWRPVTPSDRGGYR